MFQQETLFITERPGDEGIMATRSTPRQGRVRKCAVNGVLV